LRYRATQSSALPTGAGVPYTRGRSQSATESAPDATAGFRLRSGEPDRQGLCGAQRGSMRSR
jgi:hypothetical protein